jgi:hypothetical protein
MADEPPLTTVGRRAIEAVAELVGYPAEGVTGIRRTDDGWIVTIELREVERVPETTDVLASYEVEVDRKCQVVGYRRSRRYLRAQVED